MKKLLLMGGRGVGKTSMHSVIFAQYPTHKTSNIGHTTQKKQHNYTIMGTLKFKLQDCPGQEGFMEDYFKNSIEMMVKDVKILIYVFDASEDQNTFQGSLKYWNLILQNVQKYNTFTTVFVILHKIDLLKNDQEKAIKEKSKLIREAFSGKQLQIKKIFQTSIYNESLFFAWSEIVRQLIPFKAQMQKMLKNLCVNSLFKEAAILERASYLVISYHRQDSENTEQQYNLNLLRYQRIANTLKQFKIICTKEEEKNIEHIEINIGERTGLISQLTKSQNIFVIYNEKESNRAVANINIKNLGKKFSELKKQKIQQ